MYDYKPFSYGTYQGLVDVLSNTNGDIMTINHTEFNQFLDAAFDGKGILHVLKDNGIDITANGGEVIEKTGLIALAGAIKGIDRGLIPQGTKILCCLTGGISDADGKAVPEYKG